VFARAEVYPGAWKLPHNDVWNVPDDVHELRFEFETVGPWSIIRKLRGIAMTLDGKVFGERSLLNPKESGYQMEGQVSIEGKKYRAFTSSQLFERPDGSLCDVAMLVVCDYNARQREQEKP